jgi:hypothetical protein
MLVALKVLVSTRSAPASRYWRWISQLFQDREHELLLAHGARVLDLDLLGEAQKLRRRFGLQFLQLHFLHALLLQEMEMLMFDARGVKRGISRRGNWVPWREGVQTPAPSK